MEKYQTKLMWIHINFWFKKNNKIKTTYIPRKHFEEFKKIISKLISKFQPKRKFFLFEPDPDCFLAMEICLSQIPQLEKFLRKTKFPKFIRKVSLLTHTDENNNGYGQQFLDIMNIYTDELIYPKRLIGKLATKITHCALNQLNHNLLGEALLYKTSYIKTIDYLKEIIEKNKKYGYLKETLKSLETQPKNMREGMILTLKKFLIVRIKKILRLIKEIRDMLLWGKYPPEIK